MNKFLLTLTYPGACMWMAGAVEHTYVSVSTVSGGAFEHTGPGGAVEHIGPGGAVSAGAFEHIHVPRSALTAGLLEIFPTCRLSDVEARARDAMLSQVAQATRPRASLCTSINAKTSRLIREFSRYNGYFNPCVFIDPVEMLVKSKIHPSAYATTAAFLQDICRFAVASSKMRFGAGSMPQHSIVSSASHSGIASSASHPSMASISPSSASHPSIASSSASHKTAASARHSAVSCVIISMLRLALSWSRPILLGHWEPLRSMALDLTMSAWDVIPAIFATTAKLWPDQPLYAPLHAHLHPAPITPAAMHAAQGFVRTYRHILGAIDALARELEFEGQQNFIYGAEWFASWKHSDCPCETAREYGRAVYLDIVQFSLGRVNTAPAVCG